MGSQVWAWPFPKNGGCSDKLVFYFPNINTDLCYTVSRNGQGSRVYSVLIEGIGGLTMNVYQNSQTGGDGLIASAPTSYTSVCYEQSGINYGTGFMSWEIY
jgi:hypothetical protein